MVCHAHALPLQEQVTRSLEVKANGRSADATSPHFILGCNAPCSYCYVRRWNRPKVYVNANVEEILQRCHQWVEQQPWPKPANQTDAVYYTIDIACDTDVSFHWKDQDWLRVFAFFRDHPKLKATFATKYVNNKLLDFNPQGKVRVRFSLMPQVMADIVEGNTARMLTRIKAIDRFRKAGYEVHVNFSPIILCRDWLAQYRELFTLLRENVQDLSATGLECIFLTHNQRLHELNLQRGLGRAEHFLWVPSLQEEKDSQYGGRNVRYNWQRKAGYISQFLALQEEVIPECRVRYIF